MLIQRAVLDGIAAGRIDLAFRCWTRPTVRAGGRLRTAIGELAIEDVTEVATDDVTDDAARRAGFADRAALFASLRPDGRLYRVQLRLAGPDPRVALRERSELAADELDDLRSRLDRFDRNARGGSWTATTLRLIAADPGRRAPDLAAELGRPAAAFKTDVRKLKALGLTESLEIGYRLSPRGAALLAALDASSTTSM